MSVNWQLRLVQESLWTFTVETSDQTHYTPEIDKKATWKRIPGEGSGKEPSEP